MANTISILIQAKDQASSTLENVGDAISGTGEKSEASSKKVSLMERSTAALAATTALAGAGMFTLKNVITDSIDAANRYTNAMTGLSSISEHFSVNSVEARKAAQDLATDGLMSVTEAAGGLKNLLASGFSLPEAINLMNRFKDSASFNRQAALGFGESIVGATEGIKNGNSILVDNAGVTKNLSIMLEEAGFSAQDLMKATSDNNIRQAIYKGILKETSPMVGDAAKLADSFAGKQALLSTKTDLLQRTLGAKLQPVLSLVMDKLMPLVGQVTEFIDKNPQLTQQIAISAAAFVGLGTAIGGVLLAVQLIGGPVGLAVMGISAAVAVAAGYIMTHWDDVKKAFVDSWQKVKDTWSAAGDFMNEVFKKVIDAGKDSVKWLGDRVDDAKKSFESLQGWLTKNKDIIQATATVLGVVFGPALAKAAVEATVAGVKMAASGVAAGAGWTAGAIASGASWTVWQVKMLILTAGVRAMMVKDAILAGAAWARQVVVASAIWVAEMVKISVATSVTAVKSAAHAADVGYAWAINAARASFVWVTTELPKIVAGFVVVSTQAVVHAAAVSTAWITSAARTSFTWVVTELPKIVTAFIVTSGQAVAQAAITSGAWIASASQTAVAWVVTQLPRIIAAFISMSASAVANAAVATAAWVTSAATSSASFAALSALVATPIVMPAIVVTAALAAIASVWNAYKNMKNAIEEAKAAQEAYNADSLKTSQHFLNILYDGVSSPEVKARARQYLHNTHFPGYATGTRYASGGTTLVGEMGPEIVNLPRGSEVINAYKTRGSTVSGGGASVNIEHFTVNNNMDEQRFLKDLGWRLALS